jgi:tetratricopeptide (TPR) repeat protein
MRALRRIMSYLNGTGHIAWVLILLLVACSQSSEAFLDKGRELMREQKFTEAVGFLNKSIEKDATNAEAFNARGVAHYELKQYKEAQMDYARAIELRPDFYKPYYNRARVKTTQRDLPGALKDYSEAIRLQPDSADLYFDRGYVYFESSRFREALLDFDKAILLNPRNPDFYYNRGTVKVRLTDFSGGVADFQQSVRLNANYAKGYYSLGMAEIIQKQPEAGCRHLEQAERLGYPEAKEAILTYCGQSETGLP